ncbi:AAA family ATPase [Carpediemonas membranifera]|uniref:AAA family ATPase n=1 Tax=Carpediemonas membranifera TaxID=201153 RepID=A0A8J6AW63_9EUKA|nr:AAA family ATPase [Carpediemonas membranifera]|eukprot:KAG9393995.1 AAA family ATPase [Carpediemonas membranifera]
MIPRREEQSNRTHETSSVLAGLREEDEAANTMDPIVQDAMDKFFQQYLLRNESGYRDHSNDLVELNKKIYVVVRNRGSESDKAQRWFLAQLKKYYVMLDNYHMRERSGYELVDGLYTVVQEAGSFQECLDVMFNYVIGSAYNSYSKNKSSADDSVETMSALYQTVHVKYQDDVIKFIQQEVTRLRSGDADVDVQKIINAFKAYKRLLSEKPAAPRPREVSGQMTKTADNTQFIKLFGVPLMEEAKGFWIRTGKELREKLTVPDYVETVFDRVAAERRLLSHESKVFESLEAEMLFSCMSGLVDAHTDFLLESGDRSLRSVLSVVLKDATAVTTVAKITNLAVTADRIAREASETNPDVIVGRTSILGEIQASVVASFKKSVEELAEKYIAKFIAVDKPDRERALKEFCRGLVTVVLPPFNQIIKGGLDRAVFHDALSVFVKADPRHFFTNEDGDFILPLYLAKYVNLLTTKDVVEIEKVAEHVVDALIAIHDRDQFIVNHKRNLADRLLDGGNLEVENAMLKAIGEQDKYFDMERIHDMRQMIADISKHSTRRTTTAVDGVEFTPLLIQQQHWAIEPAKSFPYPAALQGCADHLVAQETAKNDKVEVRFLPDKGAVHIQFEPEPDAESKRVYSVSMTPLQYAVFMHVLEAPGPVPVSSVIGLVSSIPREVIAAHLFQLFTPKKVKDRTGKKVFRLSTLLKITSPVTDDDIIDLSKRCDALLSVNTKFKSTSVKVQIGVQPIKITRQAERDAVEATGLERELSIDSAIVRIMKGHRQMRHHDLLLKISDEVKRFFNPQPRDMKQRIEHLIEHEYLERSADDQELYIYKP